MAPVSLEMGVDGPGAAANLAFISYEKLFHNDPEESAKLFAACTEWGFFYLDLSSDTAKAYRATSVELHDVAVQYFEKPLLEKMRDTNDDWGTFNICGYKPRSLDTGNMDRKKDGCEGLRLPADEILLAQSNGHLSFPAGVLQHRGTASDFVQKSHAIATLVLSRLSTSLGLQGPERLEELHLASKPSTTTAVLQHYPFESDLPPDTSTGHFAHTDTGSLTILFNTEWGLQVCSPHGETWKFVPPARPDGGYAIVNIGDTAKFLSGGRLKSSLHRVVPCQGRWAQGPRYATIFFLRANNDVEFEDLEGRRWNARDWLNRKFLNYRSSHEVQRMSPMATGRVGFVGLWTPALTT